jgi:uncharacterized membrane protein YgaE (UPF0421/DUF939 family)
MIQRINRSLIIYIAKCVAGCIVVFGLSAMLKYNDFRWCLISVMLVLTPESKEAIGLAMIRIKANLIGGIVSLICLLIASPTTVMIIIAISVSIFICHFFNLMQGSRAAIAAVIIIMLHGMDDHQKFFWLATFERIISVVSGCVIALLITILFHRNLKSTTHHDQNQEG